MSEQAFKDLKLRASLCPRGETDPYAWLAGHPEHVKEYKR
jgi:hypothetical protein